MLRARLDRNVVRSQVHEIDMTPMPPPNCGSQGSSNAGERRTAVGESPFAAVRIVRGSGDDDIASSPVGICWPIERSRPPVINTK
jgi:hypothetical protein